MKLHQTIKLTIENKQRLAIDQERESKVLRLEAEKNKLITQEFKNIHEESDPLVELRESVALFAVKMETNLQEHDADRGDRGWVGDSVERLRERLNDELRELDEVLHMIETNKVSGRPEMPELLRRLEKEAGDCGNFLMMIVDNLRERHK